MPRGDGTGPQGMGSMTGRAAGYCAGFGVPGFANAVGGFGRGFGGGFGGGRGGRGGRGFRNRYCATGLTGWQRAAMPGQTPFAPGQGAPGAEAQLDMLKDQAQMHADALEDIRKRIDEIESAREES